MTEQELISAFGVSLKRWRQKLGMSRIEFADFVGVNPNTVTNYEHCHFMPTLYTAMRIADRLGISVNDLIYGGKNDV